MKVTSFRNTSEIQRLRVAVDAALAGVAAEFGVKLKAGSAVYDVAGKTCTIKLEANVIDASGVAADPARDAFTAYCSVFGMLASDLGRTFTHAGDTYAITGLKPSAPKFPILARNVRTGRGYKFPADTVTRALRAASAAPARKAA